jgi:predicted glycoside hydrolase/deacetylase ChbG (UPF0249 family)
VRLIVNADDVGASADINEATFARTEAGRVTSGSILATGGAFDDAARAAREQTRVSWGVHLDVSSGVPPLTRFVPRVLRDGRLSPASLELRAEDANAVLTEWEAQVRRVREAGIEVTHLDSHEHYHYRPVLRGVIRALAARVGVRNVRAMGAPPGAWRLRARLRKWVHDRGLPRTTEAFWSLSSFRDAGFPHATTCEIMVHPGNPASPAYAEELALLDAGVLEALRGVRPCSWRDI